MTLLRAIRDDLVEKRLWPIAVALALALVAVPVVLGQTGGGGEPAALPAASPAATQGAGDPAVTGPATASAASAQPVVLRETQQPTPTGRFNDPFRGSKGKKGATPEPGQTSTPGAATTVTPEPAKPSAAPSAPISSAPTATTVEPQEPASSAVPSPSADDDPAPARYAAGYRVDLGWGVAGAPRRVENTTRLKTLKAGDDPVLVFLGVKRDGETAVFLIPSEATATGDGRCRPSAVYCHLLELKAGDTEFFDVPTARGVVQYELQLDRVRKRSSATAAGAVRWRKQASKHGRRLVAETIADGRTFARRFVYSSERGVLTFSAKGLTAAE